MKYQLIAILFLISTVVFWIVCYTLPTWLVWNCIISPKFALPYFTFSETFFTLSIIHEQLLKLSMSFPTQLFGSSHCQLTNSINPEFVKLESTESML